jgi:hypothetical protein
MLERNTYSFDIKCTCINGIYMCVNLPCVCKFDVNDAKSVVSYNVIREIFYSLKEVPTPVTSSYNLLLKRNGPYKT